MSNQTEDSVVNDTENSLLETISKTSRYVAENGVSLEEKLKEDARFSFVNPEDPHHHIYQRMLQDEQNIRLTGVTMVEKNPEPQEPYAFSFMSYAKKLTQRDLEIIKLSAAYCAANEDIDYLEKMRQKFGEDDLFGFLKPSHALNETFVHFLNQYKKVKSGQLGPPYFELKNEDFKYRILHRGFERAKFDEYSKELKSEKKRNLHLQKVQFAAFDWTKFKIVHEYTIPTSDSPETSEPLDFGQLALRRLGSADGSDIFEKIQEQEQAQDKATGSKSRKRKVRAAGETRLKRRNIGESAKSMASNKFIECPISHKMIPEEKFDKHLQVLLVDPHYKVEREKYEAKHKLSNLSSNEVYENVKRIAKGTNKSLG